MSTTENQNIINLISKRDNERKLDIQKRKDLKELSGVKEEKFDFFEDEFTKKSLEIDELVKKSSSIPPDELPNHFNVISNQLLVLQKHVSSSSIFLRSYDIKKCKDILQTLSNQARELEDQLLPKKKFGFKNKNKASNNMETIKTGEKVGNDEADLVKTLTKVVLNNENLTTITGKIKENLCLSNEEIFKKDVSLDNLENCTVKLLGAPSTLHLNNLKFCTILTGPVSTSIFVSNCENCTLVIACQQLRLHTSKNIEIYLHVTSRAIMEDCSQIFIAPYNLVYENKEKHFEISGLDINTNNWKSVDDFNWLNIDQQSPNWKELEECNRKNFSMSL